MLTLALFPQAYPKGFGHHQKKEPGNWLLFTVQNFEISKFRLMNFHSSKFASLSGSASLRWNFGGFIEAGKKVRVIEDFNPCRWGPVRLRTGCACGIEADLRKGAFIVEDRFLSLMQARPLICTCELKIFNGRKSSLNEGQVPFVFVRRTFLHVHARDVMLI